VLSACDCYSACVDTFDGNKKGKWEYKTGVKHGLEENYYENGAIKARLNWEDGVPVGQSETYYLNGK
jgi:antitoxin component YwqK of YwqJK toxin-antitoxin module